MKEDISMNSRDGARHPHSCILPQGKRKWESSMVENMNRWWKNLGVKGLFLKGSANHLGDMMGPTWRQSSGCGQCLGHGSAA